MNKFIFHYTFFLYHIEYKKSIRFASRDTVHILKPWTHLHSWFLLKLQAFGILHLAVFGSNLTRFTCKASNLRYLSSSSSSSWGKFFCSSTTSILYHSLFFFFYLIIFFHKYLIIYILDHSSILISVCSCFTLLWNFSKNKK